jgi:hypothetical protein
MLLLLLHCLESKKTPIYKYNENCCCYRVAQVYCLLAVVHVLGRHATLTPLEAVQGQQRLNPRARIDRTHFCRPQALMRMLEMSMKPVVAVGSKPPISSMDENLAS